MREVLMGHRSLLHFPPPLQSPASAFQWPPQTRSQRPREPVGTAQMGQPQGRQQSGEGWRVDLDMQTEDVQHWHILGIIGQAGNLAKM